MEITSRTAPDIQLSKAHLRLSFKCYAWDEISSICDNHPHLMGDTFSNLNTPLHEICSLGSAPHFLVEKILNSWERSSTILNRYGDTPLHVKCRNSQRTCSIVSLLIKHSPEALTIQNDFGETPLHVALACASYLPVIKELVQANAWTLLRADDKGRIPVHTLWISFMNTIPGAMAVRRGLNSKDDSSDSCNEGLLGRFWEKFTYVILQTDHLLCQANGHVFDENKICHMIMAQDFENPNSPLFLSLRHNPDLGLQGDHDGNNPTHIKAKEGDAQSIEFLLQICGASASIRNKKGRAPLHLAALNKVSWKEILYPLVQATPDSLCWKDPTTRLYPFMLAALVNDTDNTFQLLKAAPHVLNHV